MRTRVLIWHDIGGNCTIPSRKFSPRSLSYIDAILIPRFQPLGRFHVPRKDRQDDFGRRSESTSILSFSCVCPFLKYIRDIGADHDSSIAAILRSGPSRTRSSLAFSLAAWKHPLFALW